MHKMQEQVREFHRDVMHGPTSPAEPRVRNAELRASLILEEAFETVAALVGGERAFQLIREAVKQTKFPTQAEPDLAEAIDGCVDLLYVTYGTFEDIGLDAEPFADEVHRANMTKRTTEEQARQQAASQTPLGKVIKPPGWEPPNIRGLLETAVVEWCSGAHEVLK